MLIEKEVIRPGHYWYTDPSTNLPRKLTVTPDLCRYWHEQGNAMLSAGLTVPVPMEHDFDAHPMTPADRLKGNAGWVKEYRLKGNALFSALDIPDPDTVKKLPHTIRWTSPWINTFTDGKGKEWRNVISHLALTTRPRVVEQAPFGSIAAALSMATPIRGWDEVGGNGVCLSRAGLLADDGCPVYPKAFSIMTGKPLDASFAWSPQARAAAAASRKRNAAAKRLTHGGKAPTKKRAPGKSRAKKAKPDLGHKAESEPHDHSSIAHAHSGGLKVKDVHADDFEVHHLHAHQAHMSSVAAHTASKAGNSDYASDHHSQAAHHHVAAAKEHHAAGRHEDAYKHAEAANAHFVAAKHHHEAHNAKTSGYDTILSHNDGATFAGDIPPKKKPGAKPSDPSDAEFDGEFEDEDGDEEGGDDIPDDGDSTNDDDIDLEPFGDSAGDVSMTELLCDLLGALGIQVEPGADEENFKRSLYNAAMTKIHELTAKGQNDGKDPNRTNPPGQPPNNPKPGAPGGQPNPLIQQEQQPMFMSLEEIKKISDTTMKTIALSMYNENQKLRAEADADRKKLNSLNDAKLKEENAKRASRVALLGRLSPKVKADLDAMLAMPAMALSMGDGGAVVDPMAQTLAVLEKGLADLPRLLTTDAAALGVQPQPQDADILNEAQIEEAAENLSRMMGCPPQAKAG